MVGQLVNLYITSPLKKVTDQQPLFPTGGIFWTKFEPTLSKIPTPNSDLCGCLRQPHTHPPPKTGRRAKIPSPKPPSFLPARFCPLRGRAVASNRFRDLPRPSRARPCKNFTPCFLLTLFFILLIIIIDKKEKIQFISYI